MSDPSVDLSKSPDRPAILGQFSVVNRCLPADNKVILNALMSTNQRQTEKKPVFWWLDNDRRLVDGLFNDCFNRRNRPSSKKMLLLARRTQNWSADEKAGRNRLRQRLMNCRLSLEEFHFCLKPVGRWSLFFLMWLRFE